MKKKLLLTIVASLCLELAYSQSSQHPEFLKKDSIKSSLYGNVQVFYYGKSTRLKSQPLIVALHSWSSTADSQKGFLDD